MVARKGAVVLASAVLLLAVVITVNHDVRYHTSLPTASSSELLGVPAGAKTHSKGQVFYPYMRKHLPKNNAWPITYEKNSVNRTEAR